MIAGQIAKLCPGVDPALPSLYSLKRHALRSRKGKTPRNPDAIFDLEIPQEYQKDCTGKNFLQYDSGKDRGPTRVLIFASEEGLHALGRGSIWLMDGTFNVAPCLFYQLYTICVVQEDNRCFPCVYCLLKSKGSSTYVEVLNVVKNRLPVMRVELVVIDYEQAVLKALTKVFPGVQIRGCRFHFCQAIWRKI